MSFAWATVALIILLLPGFLFAYGISIPDRITREVTPRDPVTYLAAAVFVAFVIHGCCYWVLGPRVNLAVVLAVLQLQQTTASAAAAGGTSLDIIHIAAALQRGRGEIVTYIIGTSLAGLGLGIGLGWLPGTDKGSFVARLLGFQHGWAYSLTPRRKQQERRLVYAHLMTTVKETDRILMYRGTLQHFALAKDGKFSYLVLINPYRYYMHLYAEVPRTTPPNLWKLIGGSEPGHGLGEGERIGSYLVVEGTNIANVVFDQHVVRVPPKFVVENFNELVQAVEKRLAQKGSAQSTEQLAIELTTSS